MNRCLSHGCFCKVEIYANDGCYHRTTCYYLKNDVPDGMLTDVRSAMFCVNLKFQLIFDREKDLKIDRVVITESPIMPDTNNINPDTLFLALESLGDKVEFK